LPQDLKFRGERTFCVVGESTVIREYVTVHRGTGEAGETRIGSSCLIMAYAHVAHDCRIGDRVILANAVNMAGHVTVEDQAVIGGLTAIHQFVRIGCHSLVGGASRIAQDILPYTRASGNPPRVAGINVTGLIRRGFTAETRAVLARAYRIIYRRGLNTSQAVERIRAELPPIPEIVRLLGFIETSTRGLTK
jgi:UDP-N-acetylglucosamine acyltransferase